MISEKEIKCIVKRVISELFKGPEYNYEEERIKWMHADLSE